MSSNVQCIGLLADDSKSFEALLAPLANASVEDVPGHFLWTDPSGASIAFHLSEARTLACITPFFAPPDEPLTRWRVRTTEPTLDPDCEHCSGADCDILGSDGETVTRTAVQWLHFMPFRTWLEEPRDFELEVVAFARWAAFFETEAAFDEGQRVVWGRKPDEPERATPDGPALRLSPIAFLPGGMFAPDGLPMTERATAILAGRVTRVTRLVNAATGAPFYRLRIDTFPGPIDTVLDPAASESEPQPGTIALVRAWLVGRPATPPPSPPTA